MDVAPTLQGATQLSMPPVGERGADAPSTGTPCLDDAGLRNVVANGVSSAGVPPLDTPTEVAG